MLTKIEYNRNTQKVIGTYTFLTKKKLCYLYVDLIDQLVNIGIFFHQNFTTLKYKQMCNELNIAFIKQKNAVWCTLPSFQTLLDTLLKSEIKLVGVLYMKASLRRINIISQDIKLRVVKLQSLPKSIPEDTKILDFLIDINDLPIAQRRINYIMALDKVVSQFYNFETNKQYNEEGKKQTLYILMTNLRENVDGETRIIVKIGMTTNINNRIKNLIGEYDNKLIFDVVFCQTFYSDEIIDLAFLRNILNECPTSKLFFLGSAKEKEKENKSFTIKNELFYLTDDFLKTFVYDFCIFLTMKGFLNESPQDKMLFLDLINEQKPDLSDLTKMMKDNFDFLDLLKQKQDQEVFSFQFKRYQDIPEFSQSMIDSLVEYYAIEQDDDENTIMDEDNISDQLIEFEMEDSEGFNLNKFEMHIPTVNILAKIALLDKSTVKFKYDQDFGDFF